MPEGPTLLIASEEMQRFVGRRVLRVEGNSRVLDATRMRGKTVLEVRTWGKHLLLRFAGFTLKVHFMLFGSYRVDERKPNATPRLSLGFSKGEELNFYASSVQYLDQPLDDVYDWSADVLSPDWDAAAARAKLRARPAELACDALLDQSVFSGVGNIIKNEVLFRIRLHPLSTIGALPARKLSQLVDEARRYSEDFLAWKRVFQLRKHLLVHGRATCPRCGIKLGRAHLGRSNRRAFFCVHCQRLLLRPGESAAPANPSPPRRVRKKPSAAPGAAGRNALPVPPRPRRAGRASVRVNRAAP